MSNALHDTPEAFVWAIAIVVATLLGGVAWGLLLAPGRNMTAVFASGGVAMVAMVALGIAHASAWVAATRPGRWLWRVVWVCAEDAMEREELLAETSDRFDRGEET